MNSQTTLLRLLTEYKIEIPRVQRDYVQGRSDARSTIVRANLLKDIRDAYEGKTQPLDLNFVYGKTTEDGIFYPVDGQQRLTTLFLLHVYIFADDEEVTDTLKKFSYQARITTRDFFHALVSHRDTAFSETYQTPEAAIRDAAWFIDSWKYDPSVSNALRTLNDIAALNLDRDSIKTQLKEEHNPRVFFQFIKLDEIGIEDDLYIKLNARGRALTSFENFKSKLIDRCEECCGLLPELKDEIKLSLDTTWTDLIWSIAKENFDDVYLRFFETVFLNYGQLKSEANKAISKNWIYNFDYSTITEEVILAIRNTFNYIVNYRSSDAYVIITNTVKDVPSYSDRILFHVVSKYLSNENDPKSVETDSFADWMRVLRNLTNNSRIDESKDFLSAIASVNSLFTYKRDILKQLAAGSIGNLPGFSNDQINEECQKARIMCKNPSYKNEIIQGERLLPYFDGQIRSALYYSALEEQGDINVFNGYVRKIRSLFSERGPVNGILLRRALCSIGDYRLSVGNFITYKTLCIDDPSESSRTPSLKSLFSKHGEEVKELLESIDVQKPINPQLEDIINKHSVSQNDWRYCLITFPSLFERMSKSHFRMYNNGSEELLVRNKQANGINDSVYLYSLKLRLAEDGIPVEYYAESGTLGLRKLVVQKLEIKYGMNKYVISDENGDIWESTGRQDVIDEVVEQLHAILKLP